MKGVEGGLQLFREQLNPDVVKDVIRWRDREGLSALCAALQAHTMRKAFFDTFAEAMIARHLLAKGCRLQFEVETPAGKCCDFEVSDGERRFYLHIKRLDTERPSHRKLTASSRLRVLERIERPYIVAVRWQEDLTDEAMQQFVTAASVFILQARVGDEQVVHGADHRELGGVRIIAPWEGRRVSLVLGLPTGFIDDTPRMYKLLKKAYEQFMPKALNLILICSSFEEDVDDFESALLGEHIERWDTFPPRGRRIAHGRAEDGFWEGESRINSVVAGWIHFKPSDENVCARLCFREGGELDPESRAWLDELLGEPSG
ncbi:MAG: hypothetical protein IIB54_00500 [Planctomycetes bacterium]|nr:hypothetical protein [Planctomycetota bacterium]